MGVVNYFKDHLRDHSAVAKPLYEMVALATKQKTKALSWITEGYVAFEKLKALVNSCPKLYLYSSTIKYLSYCTQTRLITRMAHTYVNYVH